MNKITKTLSGLSLIIALGGGCNSNSKLEIHSIPPIQIMTCSIDQGTLGFTDKPYVKYLMLNSPKVGSNEYVECSLEIDYYKNGMKVNQNQRLIEVKPFSQGGCVGVSLAHLLREEVRISSKTPSFDKIILNFKLPGRFQDTPNKLPDPITLDITPNHISQYREDLYLEDAHRQIGIEKASIKSGISSGRY